MSKQRTPQTPEELFAEATKNEQLSDSELRLLTSGLRLLRGAGKKPSPKKAETEALLSMVSCIAFTQNTSKEIVIEMLTAHFKVDAIEFIPSHFFEQAMDYLVHLKLNRALN